MNSESPCVFCEIIVGKAPSNIRYRDTDIIVMDNILNWAPTMLLILPVKHCSQGELWKDDLITKLGKQAVYWGNKLCPNGFRIVSNFGYDAMQSQDHGHIHVLGGRFLGRYI